MILGLIASIVTIFSVLLWLNKGIKDMLFNRKAKIEASCNRQQGGYALTVKNVGRAAATNVRGGG